jgi:hypothetical protein
MEALLRVFDDRALKRRIGAVDTGKNKAMHDECVSTDAVNNNESSAKRRHGLQFAVDKRNA